MRRINAMVALGVLLGCVTGASPALASGGVNSGGVNSGGVNSGGVSSGGGGGGGSTAPAPSSSSCAHITSFSNSDGYYSVWAAIWTPYAISNSCSGVVNWKMTYTNGSTGAVDFIRTGSFMGSGAGGTIDEDWADFSTPYTVSLTVSNEQEQVLDSRSALVTTKAPKSPTG